MHIPGRERKCEAPRELHGGSAIGCRVWNPLVYYCYECLLYVCAFRVRDLIYVQEVYVCVCLLICIPKLSLLFAI